MGTGLAEYNLKGLLLYNREDYEKNAGYVQWLIETAKEKGILLVFQLKDEFLKEGLPENHGINFLINRTRSYEISLLFELNGIRVFNGSEVTLIGNNKLAGYKFAHSKGYAIAPLFVDFAHRENVISKPNDGHGGEGIGLLNQVDLSDGYFRIQQALVTNIQGDIRFYVIDNQVIHGVLRSSGDKLVSNYSQGGGVELYPFSPDEKAYVEGLIQGVPVDYAGIDFLLTRDGRLIFNEIEDVVGSRMLSHLGINDTTDLFLEHIKRSCKEALGLLSYS